MTLEAGKTSIGSGRVCVDKKFRIYVLCANQDPSDALSRTTSVKIYDEKVDPKMFSAEIKLEDEMPFSRIALTQNEHYLVVTGENTVVIDVDQRKIVAVFRIRTQSLCPLYADKMLVSFASEIRLIEILPTPIIFELAISSSIDYIGQMVFHQPSRFLYIQDAEDSCVHVFSWKKERDARGRIMERFTFHAKVNSASGTMYAMANGALMLSSGNTRHIIGVAEGGNIYMPAEISVREESPCLLVPLCGGEDLLRVTPDGKIALGLFMNKTTSESVVAETPLSDTQKITDVTVSDDLENVILTIQDLKTAPMKTTTVRIVKIDPKGTPYVACAARDARTGFMVILYGNGRIMMTKSGAVLLFRGGTHKNGNAVLAEISEQFSFLKLDGGRLVMSGFEGATTGFPERIDFRPDNLDEWVMMLPIVTYETLKLAYIQHSVSVEQAIYAAEERKKEAERARGQK